MDELISKQSVLDALRTCYETETITMDNGDEYINYGDAVGEIEQLPSAQPKRGKWMYQIGMVKCDQCLRAIRRIDHDGLLNFCPNCGAKMGGEDE